MTGREVADAVVYERLGAVEVVFVAEAHGEPAHHRLQAALVMALARHHGGRTVAAVEWLPASARGALTAWLAGFEDVERLRAAVAWDDVWGHSFAAYVPFFETLRAARIAIEPINAEPGLARAIARGETLDAAQMALLPRLDTGTPEHQSWFEQQMSSMAGHGHGHAVGPGGMERLYRAQLVWDEVMAANVIRLLEDKAHVVVCAGSGHITRALGVPSRIGAASHLIVMPLATLADVHARAADAPFPTREADLFWVP